MNRMTLMVLLGALALCGCAMAPEVPQVPYDPNAKYDVFKNPDGTYPQWFLDAAAESRARNADRSVTVCDATDVTSCNKYIVRE